MIGCWALAILRKKALLAEIAESGGYAGAGPDILSAGLNYLVQGAWDNAFPVAKAPEAMHKTALSPAFPDGVRSRQKGGKELPYMATNNTLNAISGALIYSASARSISRCSKAGASWPRSRPVTP